MGVAMTILDLQNVILAVAQREYRIALEFSHVGHIRHEVLEAIVHQNTISARLSY
jgi:hypothetical protein